MLLIEGEGGKEKEVVAPWYHYYYLLNFMEHEML